MAKKLPEGSFQITDGPPKFDLMNSLFDGKTVQITCDILPKTGGVHFCPKLNVRFEFIGREDGSNESWLGSVRFIDPNYEGEMRKFYYSSKRRTGVIHESKIITQTPSVGEIAKKW